jgi:hypothetical protein
VTEHCPACSGEYAQVKVVSGGHFGNTVVTVDGRPVDGIIGLRLEIADPNRLSELTLVIEGAEVEAEALRVVIDGTAATL